MNPLSLDEAKNIAGQVKRVVPKLKKTQVVLCPPYVYLAPLSSGSKTANLFLGSQDAFYEPSGAFTGEVSFAELPQFRVAYVIIGHSERRASGETDASVNKKVRSVTTEGMTAILCVGETVRDTHGEYLQTVRGQIVEALRDVSKKSLDNLVIAYEPVWAVGAKEPAQPREINEMAIYVKKVLHDLYGIAADPVRVLYGGAVSALEVEEIMREGFVSGLLVGRESLKPKNFIEIIKTVDNM